MIDWKKISKIDAHIHLLPDEVIEANKYDRNKFVEYGSVDSFLKVMVTYNIKKAFIVPFNDPYMLSNDHNIKTVHNNLLKMTEAKEENLYCFADIDINNNIDDTLKEFDRILGNRNFLGIKVHPTNTGYPIDGSYYEKIFAYAHEKNVLVEVHSYPRESLKDDVCSPSRINKILDKYPNLRLSIAHLGGYQYKELLSRKVYFNISAILNDFTDRLGIKKTNEILRQIGIDRLIFATDFPDNRFLEPKLIYDKYFEILGKLDFNYKEAEDICMNNALRMIDNKL